MTNEEKRIAQEMYLEGKNIASIAKMLNYCHSTISKCLPAEIKIAYHRPTKIIYPGITKWLAVNRSTVKALSEKIGEGNKEPHLSAILHGKVSPRKTTIDKILAVTGLTYEEAFSTGNETMKAGGTDGRCEVDKDHHGYI